MCVKEIELRTHNFLTILGLIGDIIGGGLVQSVSAKTTYLTMNVVGILI